MKQRMLAKRAQKASWYQGKSQKEVRSITENTWVDVPGRAGSIDQMLGLGRIT